MTSRCICNPPSPISQKFESKDIVLTRKINNVIYEIMVKTNSNMVYVGETQTLTEVLSEIIDLLVTNKNQIKDIKKKYEEIVTPADGDITPDDDKVSGFKSFKEVWDYLNINGDPKSELIRLIESKQSAEKGKGLSTNDFSDLLYEKLTNDYTKEQLDEKFKVIATSQEELDKKITVYSSSAVVPLSETEEAPENVRDGGIWFRILEKDQ